jgi:NAD(P)-dependent dehydrogenase (short-subunit alcohol dehydrogenase family)
MDLGLKGRRALVMGAPRASAAHRGALAAEGVALWVSGATGEPDGGAAELRGGRRAAAPWHPGRVANAGDMDRLVTAAERLLGAVDILVLNHGGPPPGGPLEITQDQLVEWFPRIVCCTRSASRPGCSRRCANAEMGRVITWARRHGAAIPNLACPTPARRDRRLEQVLALRSRARRDLQHPGPGPS